VSYRYNKGDNVKDLVDFFDYLSWRIYKEVHFSDITWALCNANQKFKKLFLNFCFNEETPEMEVFEREIPSHNSRPDFYCEDGKQNKWILEIKINDKSNFHFTQYRQEFPDAKCALIANYNAKSFCDTNLKFSITTWQDFVEFLIKNIDDNDLLIIGYLKYLKSIIGYLEVKNMNLNKVNSLPDFHAVLENIIHDYSKKELKFYNQSKSFFDDKFGRYVYFENKNDETIYFWIGIYFSDEETKIPYLCIEFNIDQENWVPKKEASIIKKIQRGKYSLEPNIYEGVAYFYLTDNYYDILFSENPEIEKQKEVISEFIEEILKNI
jgi:hypothetical protein